MARRKSRMTDYSKIPDNYISNIQIINKDRKGHQRKTRRQQKITEKIMKKHKKTKLMINITDKKKSQKHREKSCRN